MVGQSIASLLLRQVLRPVPASSPPPMSFFKDKGTSHEPIVRLAFFPFLPFSWKKEGGGKSRLFLVVIIPFPSSWKERRRCLPRPNGDTGGKEEARGG